MYKEAVPELCYLANPEVLFCQIWPNISLLEEFCISHKSMCSAAATEQHNNSV